MRGRLAGAGVGDVGPLAGGASSLTLAGALDGRPVVVKVAPPGVELVAHRDVLRQARIIKALAVTEVPVPAVLWEDAGRPAAHPAAVRDDACRRRLCGAAFRSAFRWLLPVCPDRYRNACRVMAALHRLSPDELGLGAEPVVDPAAEVRRWCATLQTVDAALVPDWSAARDAFLGRVPVAIGPGVVHGDFRLGNLMATGSRINAVIDWEIWSVAIRVSTRAGS